MGAVVDFPLKENPYVQNYLKTMDVNNRNTNDFMMLLNAVETLEQMLAQSNKNIVDMKNELSVLKEIQKHPIKTELNNIAQAIQENAAAAKAWLTKLKQCIVNGCKKILQNIKDVGVSALDKTASFLRLKDGLEAIGNYAAKNNALCGQAIDKIERFSTEYHKSGRALKNMGLMIGGKYPVDAVKENGKFAKAMIAIFRKQKGIWAKIERKAYVMATSLDNLQTNAQIKRVDRQHTKEVKKSETIPKADIYAKVDKNKASMNTNKKEKPHEVKKTKAER